jgi:hypothetical protein
MMSLVGLFDGLTLALVLAASLAHASRNDGDGSTLSHHARERPAREQERLKRVGVLHQHRARSVEPKGP